MISDIFDNPEVMKVGWALLHFLWQGTIIALVLKGTLMFLKHGSSRLRYALALASLCLMAASPVFLLCKPQGRNSEIPAAYETVQLETVAAAGSTTAPVTIHRRPDLRASAIHFFTLLVPWIATFWLFGMVLLCLKTVGALLLVWLLKRKAAAYCEAVEIASFHRLAARAKVARVRVLESNLVSIPTVAGWIKPVVLLPKGVLKKIDRPMLDSLVAHEFAHIRRHDGIVNLFQTFVENLLFFHPAVWWVSGRGRAEREACCDDYAVAICGDAMIYVRALSKAEQLRSSLPVMALNSSPLLQRIRRLTEMNISKTSHIKAFCIALLAVSSIVAAAAGSVLLAAIPSLNSQSSLSSGTPGSDRNSDQVKPETQVIQPHGEGTYALVCGIVGGRISGKADGKSEFPPPPPRKDEIEMRRGCLLLDVSTPEASVVPGELQASELIHKVDPVYPETAIEEHVGIRVALSINVNEKGIVTGAEVKKSQTVPPDTDSEGNWVGGVRPNAIRATNSAAINAVKQWKYSPTLLNGKAIPVATNASITFTFNKDGSPKIIAYAPCAYGIGVGGIGVGPR